MSLYTVTIGKNEYNVTLDGNRLKVNGKVVSGQLKPVNESGLHVLQRGKKSMELYLNSLDRETLEVLVSGQRVVARVENSLRRAKRRTTADDPGALLAPMPGMLVSVLAKVGDRVEEGQTLAVLESMKMQMQLRAANAGTVTSVLYRAGEQVEKGKEIILVK